MPAVPTLLVDRTTLRGFKSTILAELRKPGFTGFDTEMHDRDAHQGIVEYRGKRTAKVFDMRRATLTGFSFYADGEDHSWYFNIGQADAKNRLPWGVIENEILSKRHEDNVFICHNAPFEKTLLRQSKNYRLENVLCSLQMAVSHHTPDQYDPNKFGEIIHWSARKFVPDIIREFTEVDWKDLTTPQSSLLYKIIDKDSEADHSYNGFVDTIAYGYGLKQLVRNFLGEEIEDFQDLLERFGAADMGDLTGEQVAQYGGNDSYWAVQVFHSMLKTMPSETIAAFIDQENPMTDVYSDVWSGGIRIDLKAVEGRLVTEAAIEADLKSQIRDSIVASLPWPGEPRAEMLIRQPWYAKNWEKLRHNITAWAEGADIKFNATYWQTVRTLAYDLYRLPLIIQLGDVQSDANARARLAEKATGQGKVTIELINKLAFVDTRLKLFIRPYLKLIDPETSHIYPVISSMLATRRMASRFPNPMQLTKRGESTYIRGFYLPDFYVIRKDEDGDVVVSLDWKQIELVLIGEFSGDPEFAEAYGQKPYQDLHMKAGATLLSAMHDVEITEEMYASLRMMDDTIKKPFGFELVNAKGEKLTPKEAYKYNRDTPGGKGINFEYWYSGLLMQTAAKRGLSMDKMWEITEAYRKKFAVAERWRLGVIEQAGMDGYVKLPDGHYYNRYECTAQWHNLMMRYFEFLTQGIEPQDRGALIRFGMQVASKIQKHANNQVINALIQGSNATITKRSIIAIKKAVKEAGLRARFLIPIHDEIVWSVRKSHVMDFIEVAKSIMTYHPGLISNLVMDATASVGRTFEPWHAEKAPLGQIELDEAPKAKWIPEELWDRPLPQEFIEKMLRSW